MQDIIRQPAPPPMASPLPPLRKRISWTFVLLVAMGASTAVVGLLLKIVLSGFRLPW